MAKKAFWSVATGALVAAVIAASVALTVPAGAGVAGQPVAVGQSAAVQSGLAAVGESDLLAAADGDPTVDTPAWCDRLEKGQDRRHSVLTRLQADAATRGSIAWLNSKATAAAAAGDPTTAKLFTDKAALRSQLVGPLQTVAADVDDVIAARCS